MTTARRRLTTTLVAAITLGVLFIASSRLRLDADISRMIPDGDPRVGRAALVARALLERLTIDISFDAGPESSVEVLTTVADRIVHELEDLGVRETTLVASESDMMLGLETLRVRGPRVIDPASLVGVESRLTRSGIETRLKWLAQALQEPAGLSLAGRAATDPLGISDLAFFGLRDAAPAFKEARTVGKRIVSSDGRRLLLLLEPGFPASDVDRTAPLLDRIESIRESLARDPGTQSIQVRVLGVHRSTFDNAQGIKADVAWTATLALILAIVFTLLVYASMWHVAVALVPAIFGAALAASAFAIFRGTLAGAAAGFGSVLVGLTVDYANHAIFGIRARGRIDVRALLTSAVTTIAAFLALTASSLPVVREIGIFGAIGVLGAALSTIWVVPVLVGRGASRRLPILDLTRFMAGIRAHRTARWVPVAFIALTPLIVLHIPKIRFEGDVTRLNGLSPQAANDEKEILAAWEGGFRMTWIAAEGRTLEEALDVNDRVARTLASAKAGGELVDYASLTGLLPGPLEQQQRLIGWRAFWAPERVAKLRHDLAEAVKETPFRADGFDPFFDWLVSDPPAINLEAERSGPFAGVIRDRIMATEDGFLVTTALTTRDWNQVRGLEQVLRRDVPESIVLNKESIARRIAEIVGNEMWQLGAMALVAVLVFTWILMGSLGLALVTVAPVVVALAWTIGLLGWMRIPMTMVNAVFMAFLVGAAVDYCIVLVHSRVDRWKIGVDTTSFSEAAVLLNAVTASVGFGVLTLANHPVLRSIGVTALVGIACAWVSAYALAPLLVDHILRRRGPHAVLAERRNKA